VASPVATVHAADNNWIKAYNSGDLDNVLSLYDENAVIYTPGAPAAHRKAAIRAFWVKDNAEFHRGGLIFSLGTKPDPSVARALGWSTGTYKVTVSTLSATGFFTAYRADGSSCRMVAKSNSARFESRFAA
jgi:hypothetical protein